MGKILVNLSTGAENLDKASVAFVVAGAGIAGEQETAMFLSVEAVRLVQKGYVTDDMVGAGFKPMKELVDTIIAGGGKIWVCPPCANARGVTEDTLIEGAVFAGGAKLVEFLSQGAATVSY